MSTSRTTSMSNGATTRCMSLLLPCCGSRSHIVTLEIQEGQHRRRLVTIEHVQLFHRGKNLAHGLQVQAPTCDLGSPLVFSQQCFKTCRIPLGRVGAVDAI